MFRKLVVTSAVLVITSSIAMANAAPYVGVSVGVANNSYSGGNFRGVTTQLSGGYGATINQSFYLGGELFVNNFTITMNDNSYANSMRSTYGYGASIIPGLIISNHTMAFLRAGVVRTRFSELSHTGTGGEVGLGLQTSVTQNWDLRAEYDYVGYGNIVHGISPNADQFNLGLVYKFE
jgi:opacity protein-like surface antigen